MRFDDDTELCSILCEGESQCGCRGNDHLVRYILTRGALEYHAISVIRGLGGLKKTFQAKQVICLTKP